MHDGQIQSKTTKFVFPKGKKNTYLISRTFWETVQSLEDYADTPFPHIKEYKFRYNWENQNLYITLLENYRKQPIKS